MALRVVVLCCYADEGEGVKLAYADPPYLGLAEKFYGHLHPDAAEYDRPETHQALIDRLEADFDGWAMSLHTPSLRTILPMCPPDARVAAWVKPFASWKVGVSPAYAWEPVIFKPLPRKHDRGDATVRDWVAVSITLQRGFQGAKPDDFCRWVFEILRAEPTDEFTDIFPGSGAVGRAWDQWSRQGQLWTTPKEGAA